MARNIKTRYTAIPMVVLTPFSHGITARMQDIDLSIFEYVFCWLGNTDLLITIIKLIEDRMNLEHDIRAGVQMIMLVEDNIRFKSLTEAAKFYGVAKSTLSGALHGYQNTCAGKHFEFVIEWCKN